MSHWTFSQKAGLAKNTEYSSNKVEGKLLKRSWYCAIHIFRPLWVQNNIFNEIENLYQTTELVWPQCSCTWEAHCWQWVSLLTSCHDNLARHKDHLYVATGSSLLCCTGSPYMLYKAHPEIPKLVKYYFSPSTLPSHWTLRTCSSLRSLRTCCRRFWSVVIISYWLSPTNGNHTSVEIDWLKWIIYEYKFMLYCWQK